MRAPFFAAVLLPFALAAAAPSQNLVTWNPQAGGFAELAAVSPLYPAGGVPMLPFFAAPFPLPPAFPGGINPVPPGDCAVDATNGMVWYTNGPQLAAFRHPNFPAAMAPVPPFPAPPFPPPPGFPLTQGAFVSGLAVDPIAGILWATNGYTVQGLALAMLPAIAVVVPPFAPVFPGVVVPQLTGLEWDGLTGSLWAVNGAGVVFNFLPGGAGLGVLPPPPNAPAAVAVGVTIDKSVQAGVYVVFAPPVPAILDYVSGRMMPAMPGGAAVGVAYIATPSLAQPGYAGCPCPSNGPAAFQNLNPVTTGVGVWGVDWTGLPPGNLVVAAVDMLWNPALPFVNNVGCGFGLVLGSPSMLVAFGFADPLGRFTYAMSLAGIAPMPPLYLQYATLCAADQQLGFVLSPLFQCFVSGT
ncbi:MAG: hypothetical protein FJ265_07355 [Planctomycetes bacterium]|nr:hypothetical protein [Planctomycetota bacterium]